MSIDEFLKALNPALLEIMNSRGQAGHCILVARVLDSVFDHVEVPSHAVCVDYEVCNPVATDHLVAGGAESSLPKTAQIIRTGQPNSPGFPHHVVTVIPVGDAGVLLDPTIIQVNRRLKGAQIPMITLDLAYPLPPIQQIEVESCRLTYTFRESDTSFRKNSQWTNKLQAKSLARQVIKHMGFEKN